MIDKETYEREITRMFDSVRTNSKGEHTCSGVKCEDCPLYYHVSVCRSYGAVNAYEIYEKTIKCINYVERWSKEHPPKKYKVSKLEYDIMRAAIDYSCEEEAFKDVDILYELFINGYFPGATRDMAINYYFDNCEVKEDV